MEPIEIYVLCSTRSRTVAERFLDTFAPVRKCVTDEFTFPELADAPLHSFHSPNELMAKLDAETEEGYALYWEAVKGSAISHAILVYTIDGAMVAGIAGVNLDSDRMLAEMARVVDGQFGYITSEGRPPETQAEFIEICRSSDLPCLVNGEVRNAKSPPSG